MLFECLLSDCLKKSHYKGATGNTDRMAGIFI